jgi:FkbM family methyltransferase
MNVPLWLATILTRRIGSFPGRWRVLRWISEHPADLAFLPPRLMQLDEGSRLLVDAWVTRDAYVEDRALDKDDHVVAQLRKILRPGDTLLDIGANIGRMTVLGSRLVGDGGHVHAFEPNPKVISGLYRNIALNGCGNVTVWPQAVSDRIGTITFSMPVGTNSAWASIRELDADKSMRIDVPCLTIDSLIDRLPTVRLVKIDVEGAEFMALSGMKRLLERDHPHILLELSDAWLRELGASAQAVCDLFRGFGYSLYRLTRDGAADLREIPASQIDLLCVPPGEVPASP